MKNKFVSLSDQEHDWVKAEADRREITFSDMLRRIIDDHYEKRSPELKEQDHGTRIA